MLAHKSDLRMASMSESSASTLNFACESNGFKDARQPILQQLDAHLAKIEEIRLEVVKLKRSLNMLTPISTLPVELLEKIFLNLVCRHGRRDEDIPFRCLDCHARQGAMGQVPDSWAISQVCRHWRDLCKGLPRMWTVVPTTYRRIFMEEMTRRSLGMPLFFQLDFELGSFERFHDRDRSDILLGVLDNMPQTQELILCNWTLEQDRWLQQGDYLTRPWRIPEHLRKFAIEVEIDGTDDGHCEWPRVLSSLCPALEELSMSGFRIHSFDTALFPSLRELHLLLTSHLLATVTLDHILDVLERLQRLEKLSLYQEAHKHGNPAFSSEKTVALPHLQSLKLQAFCVLLLVNLVLPPRVVIIVDASCRMLPGWGTHTYSDIEEYTPLQAGLQAHFSRPTSLPADEFSPTSSIHLASDSRLQMFVGTAPPRGTEGWRDFESEDSNRALLPQLQIELEFFDETKQEMRSQVLLNLFRVLPVSDVRQLHMYHGKRNCELSEVDRWTELVRMMPLLEGVHISNEPAVNGFVRALSVDMSTGYPAGVLLTSLRKLVLQFGIPSRAWVYPKETDEFPDALAAMIDPRRQYNLILEELELDFLSDSNNSFWQLFRSGKYTAADFKNIESGVQRFHLKAPSREDLSVEANVEENFKSD